VSVSIPAVQIPPDTWRYLNAGLFDPFFLVTVVA
jgi:hypothetical protein